MASDHPDDTPSPNRPHTPSGSHAHPDSLPVGDWLVPDDRPAVAPDDPSAHEEMIDFSTLPEPSDPGSSSIAGFVPLDFEPLPDDGEPSAVDFIPFDPEPSSAVTPIVDLPADSVDVLADLPPAEPASGWVASGLNLGAPPPAAAAPAAPQAADESSDIFTGTAAGESDVLRSLTDPPVGESDVLQATSGSSRFEDPGDATDDGSGPPSGILRTRSGRYPDADAAEQAAWDALNDDAADATATTAAHENPDELDFNPHDPHPSGSSVFADVGGGGEAFGESGVNLLDPEAEADPDGRAYGGSGSSIFDAAPPAEPAAHAGPPSETGDAAVELFDTEAGAGHSAVFRGPAASDTTVPDADDLLDPDAADDVALGGADEPDLPVAAEARPTDAAGWDDADRATVIDGAAGSLASIDLSPEPDEEIIWADEPAPDDALGQAGGTADLQGLTSVAPVAQPAPAAPRPAARRPQKPLPLDGPRDEAEAPAPRTRPAPAKRGSGGWVGGGMVGLAAGVGACAAAYFGGLLPETAPKTTTAPVTTAAVSQAPATTPAPAAPSLADGHALLAAGDPARALKVFEAAGDADTPVVRAARGQARWQARVRELATADAPVRADDPQLKQAAADLEAVLKDPAALTTDEEKRAGAQAAFHLGVLKELTGDIDGAIRVYQDAARQFPDSREMFATAQHRLLITNPAGKAARLTPKAAHELSQAVVLALVMVQAGEKPAAPDEPGFLFWEAVNHAAAGDYAQASAAIAKAKALHDKRRLALIGRGLNPQSDPLEQIFLRACDDLRDYWALRREVYGHPTFGPMARKDGVSKSLAALTAVQKTAAGLSARVAAVTKEATAAKAAAAKLEKERDAAAAELAAVEKKLTDATAAKNAAVKAAADRAKELAAARTRADGAAKKLKAAEAAVDAVVRELKAAKLVDPSDDAAAVLAKLPAVTKRAAAAANTADARRAAETLAAVQKDLDAAQAEATKAKADLTAATVAADKARTDAERAVAAAKAEADKKVTAAKADADKAISATKMDADRMVTAARAEAKDALTKLDAEVRKATAAAQTAAQKKLDELAAALKAAQADAAAQKEAADAKLAQARADLDAQLAAKDEQHRKELAAARAGVEVPLTTSAVAAKDHAARLFTTGVDLFFRGRYAEAEDRLAAATKADEADARYWYFLGLARRVQGRDGGAAFETGAKWEAQNMPPTRVVDSSLERIQGSARRELNKYRP